MKIIIVDNDPEDRDLRRLKDHLTDDLKWDVKWIRPSPGLSETCSAIIKESDEADVLVVDIALKQEEEAELEYLSKSDTPVGSPERFGGMRICLRISSELPNLPIVLFSKFEKLDLVRHVYWVGAKLFITKGTPSDAAGNMLRSLSRQVSIREPCLVDALDERLRTEPKPWEAARVQAACGEYYKNIHSHRRFAILCAKMESPLAKVCASKTGMAEFVQYMIESHDMIAVSDPAVPDHIRHSGNVFFVGHYLLNTLETFQLLEKYPH